MKNYATVPSSAQFKSDSSVLGATRAKDQNLFAIDALLDTYMRTMERDARFTVLTELFFTINSWVMALRAKSPGVEPKRYDAVMALLAAVEKELMTLLGVGNRGTLAHELVKVCGLTLTTLGANTDSRFVAQSMKSARREAAKLHIQGGVIRRYTVDIVGAPRGLQPVNSGWFVNNSIARGNAGVAIPDAAPFVMSMEREFYMAYHFHGSSGVYHSAYFGGGAVGMAGTMVVKNGKLVAIRGDSGHYQPGPAQMANALRTLRSRGVDLKGVLVYDYLRYVPPRLAEAMRDGSFSLEGHQPHQIAPTMVGATSRPPRPLAPLTQQRRFPNQGRPLPPTPTRYNNAVPASYANNPGGQQSARRPSPNAGRPLPPIPTPYNNMSAAIDAEAYMSYN